MLQSFTVTHMIYSIQTKCIKLYQKKNHSWAQCCFICDWFLTMGFCLFRWFFDALGHPKTSAGFMYNGILMTVTFFLSRILAIPPYWYKVYTIYNTPPCDRLGNIFLVLLASCFVLDALNFIWFRKIYKGALKVLGIDKKLKSIHDRKAA